jgi:hypothetical protein
MNGQPLHRWAADVAGVQGESFTSIWALACSRALWRYGGRRRNHSMPIAAIFADTYESAAVYKWLIWLEEHLPFGLPHHCR